MDNKTRVASLRRLIELAFADVPYPGDDKIGQGGMDGEKLQNNFRGRHWRDIPNDILHWHQDDLCFFTLAGHHFFLPAYLLGSIQEHEDWELEISTIYSLTMPAARHPRLIKRFLARMSQMDAAQANAITEFLRFKRDTYQCDLDREEVQRALDGYWEPRALGREIKLADLAVDTAEVTDGASHHAHRQEASEPVADATPDDSLRGEKLPPKPFF